MAIEDTSKRTALGYLAAATGVAAFVVGVLYTVGAVLIAGQLRDTGVPTRDVLPLVPLPQMLGRGMSALLTSLGVVLLAFAIGAAGLWVVGQHETWLRGVRARFEDIQSDMEALHNEAKEGDPDDLVTPEQAERLEALTNKVELLTKSLPSTRFESVAMWCLATVMVVFSIVFTDPAFMAFGLLLAILAVLRALRWVTVRTTIIGIQACAVVGFLMSSYYYPQPLPQIAVVTTTGRTLHGTLVSQTGGGFYFTGRTSRVQFVPSNRVRYARVTSAARRSYPSLYRHLRGRG